MLMPTKQRVLIVVSHPDDAELAMGMKIASYIAQGHEVFIHCLSKGSVDDPDLAEVRVKECLRAGAVLGVTGYSFSDILDTRFADERSRVNAEMFRVINELRPYVVYTHYPEDQHLDHRITAEEVLIVAEREVFNIRFFRSPYSKNFSPNLFFFGDEQLMDKKRKALQCFHSQSQFDMHVLTTLSSMVYYQSLHHRIVRRVSRDFMESTPYVELFVVERHIEY